MDPVKNILGKEWFYIKGGTSIEVRNKIMNNMQVPGRLELELEYAAKSNAIGELSNKHYSDIRKYFVKLGGKLYN